MFETTDFAAMLKIFGKTVMPALVLFFLGIVARVDVFELQRTPLTKLITSYRRIFAGMEFILFLIGIDVICLIYPEQLITTSSVIRKLPFDIDINLIILTVFHFGIFIVLRKVCLKCLWREAIRKEDYHKSYAQANWYAALGDSDLKAISKEISATTDLRRLRRWGIDAPSVIIFVITLGAYFGQVG